MDDARRKEMIDRIQRLREENDDSIKKIEAASHTGERNSSGI
jgi:hypothetical protein